MDSNRKLSNFENAVYDAVRQIPPGKVASYGWVVGQIARGTARAVGTALARNPFAPEVPCHRVVRKDGSLGGFFGETAGPQLGRKAEMLKCEGVPFKTPGKVDPNAFIG